MKIELIYFEAIGELREILNMSNDELCKAGLDLDDCDYGFIIKDYKKEYLPLHLEEIMQTYARCNVEWKEVEQSGIKFFIGMSYHA